HHAYFGEHLEGFAAGCSGIRKNSGPSTPEFLRIPLQPSAKRSKEADRSSTRRKKGAQGFLAPPFVSWRQAPFSAAPRPETCKAFALALGWTPAAHPGRGSGPGSRTGTSPA